MKKFLENKRVTLITAMTKEPGTQVSLESLECLINSNYSFNNMMKYLTSEEYRSTDINKVPDLHDYFEHFVLGELEESRKQTYLIPANLVIVPLLVNAERANDLVLDLEQDEDLNIQMHFYNSIDQVLYCMSEYEPVQIGSIADAHKAAWEKVAELLKTKYENKFAEIVDHGMYMYDDFPLVYDPTAYLKKNVHAVGSLAKRMPNLSPAASEIINNEREFYENENGN